MKVGEVARVCEETRGNQLNKFPQAPKDQGKCVSTWFSIMSESGVCFRGEKYALDVQNLE